MLTDLRGVKKSRMPLADEPALVREAKSGDSEAFGTLYDAYLERIYRFVYFRVEDQQTAEDITSQVFLKAWENPGKVLGKFWENLSVSYEPSNQAFL